MPFRFSSSDYHIKNNRLVNKTVDLIKAIIISVIFFLLCRYVVLFTLVNNTVCCVTRHNSVTSTSLLCCYVYRGQTSEAFFVLFSGIIFNIK